MAWYNELYDSAKKYLKERYLGDDAASNIVKDVTSLGTAYTTIADQKRANEALESAYRDYTKDKAESQETIDAALALGLQPMPVSNIPTKKSDITEFTEVQDVAKGGLMSLPSKHRKKYGFGVGPNDAGGAITGTLEPEIEPNWFDLMYEEGVEYGPQVKNLIDNLIEQGVIDENTSEEELKKILDQIQQAKGNFNNPPYKPTDESKEEAIEFLTAKKGGLMSLPNKKRKRYAGGPDEFEVETMDEEIITPHDLQMEEGVQIGPMVQEPELVKPPWMTQEEFLNFQYSRNQAARGGIMKLRHGGRPGYQQGIGPNQGSPSIMADANVTEERTYPTDHKFWELVDWEYEDKKSKEKEDAINADMEAGMAWEDIEKKYNLKSFEDVSIKETEREETDSGNKVKEIFEKIKEKVGSIDFSKINSKLKHSMDMRGVPYPFAQGGRIGYQDGGGGDNLSKAKDVYNSVYGTDSAGNTIYVKDLYSGGFEEFLEIFRTHYHAKGGRVKRDNGGIMNLGGMEKDYRTTGGFVPIGAYERKDDVPARLSKNEFVMTADAVRAAGGGSINQGAQKMYNIMKNLEAQPTAKRRIA